MAEPIADLVARVRLDMSQLDQAAAKASTAMGNVNRAATDALKSLPDDAGRLGDDAGRRLGDGMFREVNQQLGNARARFVKSGEAIGDGAGGGISRGLRRSLKFDDLDRGISRVKQSLDGLGRGPMYALMGAGIGVLVQQAGALVAALGPVIGILAAIPAYAAVATASIGTLLVGLSGIGASLKSTAKTGGKVATDTRSQQRAIENATKAVEKAQRGVVLALRAVEDAHKEVADAIEEVNDAQKRSLATQSALNDARAEAQRVLASYQDQLAEASVSEEEAAISLAEAQNQLHKYVEAGLTDSLILRKARNEVAKAELKYQEAIKSNISLQGKAAAAIAAGVEGDQNVIDAKDAITEAQSDAQDAAESLSKAQLGVADANYALIEAQDNVVESQKDVADAMAALTAASAASGGAIDKQAEAMAKLAPSALAAVKVILGLKGAWESLTRAVQQALFENLDRQITKLAAASLPTLWAGMVGVASAMNLVAIRATDAMSTPLFQGAMAKVFEITRTMTLQFADAVGPLTTGLMNLAAAGGPVVLRFNEFVTGGLKAAGAFLSTEEGANKMTDVMQRAGDILASVWQISINLGKAMIGIFSAAGIDGFLASLERATARFAEWTKSAEGQEKLTALFASLADVASALGGALIVVGGVILTVLAAVQALPDPVKDLIFQMAGWSLVMVPVLQGLAKMSGLISIVRVAMSGVSLVGGGLGTVLGGLSLPVLAVVVGIAALVAGLIYAYTQFESFRDVVNTAAGAVVAFVRQKFTEMQVFVAEIWPQIQEAITNVMVAIQFVVEAVLTAITTFWRVFGDDILRIVSAVWGTIKEVISAQLQIIQNVIRLALALINGDWGAAWNALKGILGGVWDGIFAIVRGAINNLIAILGGAYDGIKTAVVTAFSAIWDVAKDLHNAFKRLGVNIIEGLLEGMGSLLGNIARFMADKLPAILRDPFLQAMGINSPSTVFAEYGRNIGQGLIVGLASMRGGIAGAMQAMSANVTGGLELGSFSVNPDFTGTGLDVGMSGGSSGSGSGYQDNRSYTVNLPTVPYAPSQVGEIAIDSLRNLELAHS